MGLKEAGLRGSLRNVSVGADVIPDSGNLQSHYVASSFSLNDGDAINSSWTDEAGSFDATVNGAPTYQASAINSKPAVSFDATDDFFDTGHTQNTDDPATLYVVANWAGTNQLAYGARAVDPDIYSSFIYRFGSGNYGFAYADNNGFDANKGPESGFVINSHVAGGGTVEGYENGTNIQTESYTPQGSVGFADYIGARNNGGSPDGYFGGSIAEILRYDVRHDDQTRSDVELYLSNKYGIGV